MQLSKEAIKELEEILRKEAGGGASDFAEEELNEIGELLLAVLAERLKME